MIFLNGCSKDNIYYETKNEELKIDNSISLELNETIKKERLEENYYKCEKNSDCISVQAGCCACNMMGSNIAINKKYFDFWENKLSEDCKEISCLQAFSDHISCFSEPRCVDGFCKLIQNKEL